MRLKEPVRRVRWDIVALEGLKSQVLLFFSFSSVSHDVHLPRSGMTQATGRSFKFVKEATRRLFEGYPQAQQKVNDAHVDIGRTDTSSS